MPGRSRYYVKFTSNEKLRNTVKYLDEHIMWEKQFLIIIFFDRGALQTSVLNMIE